MESKKLFLCRWSGHAVAVGIWVFCVLAAVAACCCRRLSDGMLPRARPRNGSLLIENGADCRPMRQSYREWHNLIRLSCNMLDFFGRRTFRPLRMRATSFISTPAFSVVPWGPLKCFLALSFKTIRSQILELCTGSQFQLSYWQGLGHLKTTQVIVYTWPAKTATIPFLQRVSIACYAKRCISYRKSVRLSGRPSVC